MDALTFRTDTDQEEGEHPRPAGSKKIHLAYPRDSARRAGRRKPAMLGPTPRHGLSRSPEHGPRLFPIATDFTPIVWRPKARSPRRAAAGDLKLRAAVPNRRPLSGSLSVCLQEFEITIAGDRALAHLPPRVRRNHGQSTTFVTFAELRDSGRMRRGRHRPGGTSSFCT
jgi:hypothetical protein